MYGSISTMMEFSSSSFKKSLWTVILVTSLAAALALPLSNSSHRLMYGGTPIATEDLNNTLLN